MVCRILAGTMRAISLTTVLEQVAAEATGTKHHSGNLAKFEALMAPANLHRLDASFDAFGFLAFHPGADLAVRSYVEEGTLASDSGRQLLILFTMAQTATWPTVVSERSFGPWLEIDGEIHPSYAMVEWLFEPRSAPPLPGIALFDSLAGEHEVVYVPLDVAGGAVAIRAQLRRTFALAREARAEGALADRLGRALQRQRIEYVRSDRRSVAELLIRTSQTVGDRVSDIVSVAGLAV